MPMAGADSPHSPAVSPLETDAGGRQRLAAWRHPERRLHDHPPLTPAGVLLRYRYTVPALLGVFAFLAVAAAVDGGSLALVWDEPLQRGIERNRTPFLDTFFERVSELGGTTFVLLGLASVGFVVWRRCRSVAWVLLAATVARPLLEWVLKAAIDRPRPRLEPLLPGRGPSFPSGHVMAAIALWGLVPPIVALLTERRRWWWWATAMSGVVIGLVAASRVYLGVHWVTDVTGALVLGCLYLLAVETVLDWHHHRRPCRPGGDTLDRGSARPFHG